MYIGNEDGNATLEKFSLNTPSNYLDNNDQSYMEAVFSNGKEKVKSLEEKIQRIKDKLEEEIIKQDKSVEKNRKSKGKYKVVRFDPKAFWKDTVFKDLEDELVKVFGFRNVEIYPRIERYISDSQIFSSRILNCFVWSNNRFPIEGLVTDDGFYDKSRSTCMQIQITLGLIKALEADELLAVLLHEFGHGIDPALVDIKYTEINILSKYMTDRKNAINSSEKSVIKKKGITSDFIFLLIELILLFLPIMPYVLNKIYEFIVGLVVGKEKLTEMRLEKVRKMVKEDKDKFNRREFYEAYADNFARMYGYAAPLMRGLQKISKDDLDKFDSRHKRENARQSYIMEMTGMLIKDVHKTDIHRIRNLIKEYKEDINDPNTPAAVKKQLKEDLVELEKVLDEYLNNFSDFQNRVNRIINEELEKIEVRDEKRNAKKKEKDESMKEGFEFFDESAKAYEKLMKAKESLNNSERAEVKERFGQSAKCSFAKDKDGYYCFTHRCRSDSYPSIADIPEKSVEFVRSTC